MAIKDYFFNAVLRDGVYDRIYNSEDVTSYLDLLVGNGVFMTPATQLQVSAAGGMTVNVNVGQGWINGHKLINTTVMSLSVEHSDVVLNRIDRVIFYVDHVLRSMGIEVKAGTPANTPVAPVLIRNAQRYELCLAEISIGKQVTEISDSQITDTRSNSELCGYVTGLIQQIDTTNLFQQFQTGFDEWFAEVKDELVTATLLRKYEANYVTEIKNEATFNVKELIPQYGYALDILEIRINGLSLGSNEYTKDHDNVTLLTPIAEIGTPVDFVIYKSVDASDAESVVDDVIEMKSQMETIMSGMYIATGENDNVKLSNVVKTFLNGGSDYKQLEIDVYGHLEINATATELTEAGIAYWFDFNVQNSTRRVKLNFAHCSRVVVNANESDSATDVFMYANNTEIANLQAVMNNVAAGNMIVGNSTCEDCAFWLNGLSDQTGTITGAEEGTFVRCRMSVTAENGIAYGFSGNGNVLRLSDCEVIAYNKTSVSAESVSVHVKGGETTNILLMTNCTCPVTSRNGYKQSNVVKVNSGYYALLGNTLGKQAALYSTGTGKTELGTIFYTGGGSKSVDDMVVDALSNDTIADLETTTKTIVGAINELFSSIGSGDVHAVNNKVPDSHGNVALRASDIPASGNSNVQSDLNSIEGSLAVIEGDTASRNFTAGEYIVRNGMLYKVRTAVSSGATWGSGNSTQLSLGSEVSKLSKYIDHWENIYPYSGHVDINNSGSTTTIFGLIYGATGRWYFIGITFGGAYNSVPIYGYAHNQTVPDLSAFRWFILDSTVINA